MVTVTDQVMTYKIIAKTMECFKTENFQSVQIYPHRDEMLFCYYWSLVYWLVMSGDSTEYMFPDFAKKIIRSETSKVDSKGLSLLQRQAQHFDMDTIMAMAMTLLRFHCTFIDLIRAEPKGRYKAENSH